MEEAMKLIARMAASGRAYGRRGLLYEAAYRYGQCVSMLNMLYLLHSQEVIKLPPAIQNELARLHEKVAALSMSLGRSAGNGRHKLGDADSDSKESLIRVVAILEEDLQSTDWL